jgi:hypothetical protein
MKQEKPKASTPRVIGLISIGVVLVFVVLPLFTFEFWQMIMVQLLGFRPITNMGQVGMIDMGLLIICAAQYFILRERWDD